MVSHRQLRRIATVLLCLAPMLPGAAIAEQFTLNLQIDPQDLQQIQAEGLNITVGQKVNDADPNVAWLSFRPLQQNVVQWQAQYGLFASNTQLVSGAQIVSIATVSPAQVQSIYPFLPDMAFGSPQQGGPSGSYSVQNQSTAEPSLTFGLVQDASVNGQTMDQQPVNGATVSEMSDQSFTPNNDAVIWLQAGLESGTVIDDLPQAHASVQFSSSVTSATLQYQASTGTFVPVN